ncbi:MAG: alpha/beta fold hydrolase [Pseudomonadota bacterium]
MMWTTRPRSDLHGLAALRAGDGPRVVLLHGVGLRAEAWAPIIDGLSGQFSVIAPDMPGHGQSPRRDGMQRVADYAAALAPLLGEPAHVVGHSMGAMIALHLAATQGAFVRSVTAFNAVFERSAQAQHAVQARADSLDGETSPDPTPTLARWFGDHRSPEQAACATWLSEVDPRGYRQAYCAFAYDPGPSRAELAQITCPAHFVTGGLEPNSTPVMSHAMAALCPQGRAQIVADAAHMLPMTHPTEALRGLALHATTHPCPL